MPFVEQLLFGGDHRRDPAQRGVLGVSAGMGADVAAEVERLCRGWGDVPPLGLDRPALMSFPLLATMPSIRGRLYAVIRVGTGSEPLFHAIVLGDASYVGFDRNPYLLARQMSFHDAWRPGVAPPRVELEADTHEFPAALVPGPTDRGFIDEAVVQFILKGSLVLPLEQSTPDSDRSLALVISCLPAKLRRELRFASLATSEANGCNLGALATTGAGFAGWQRFLLATPNSGMTPEISAYQAALGQQLAAGDLNAIARLSLRHEFGGGREQESIRASVPDARGAEPRPVVARPLETPLAAVISTPPLTTAGGSRSVRRSGPGEGTARAIVGARRPLSRRSGLARVLAVIAVVFLAGGVVALRMNGRLLARSLEWAGIPGMNPEAGSERAATLLEVVDVGAVYEDQRSQLAGSGGALGPSLDQARRKALANLSGRGATPLVAQIDLFAKLSADGIQQGSRPDRETERLRALARQGEVLASELTRLELAWHSLAAGAMWRDLGQLPDEAVAARSDSLARRDRAALDEARTGMGLTWKLRDLTDARRNVEGMAALVELFQAESWSPRWTVDLKRAADRVSPTASPLTRAYRNCAFKILRVKEAERSAAARSLAYAPTLIGQAWPAPAIRDILPDLRRAAGVFPPGDAPALVAGTLKLYADLSDPVRAAERAAADPHYLAKLEGNAAFRFDAAAHRPFLDRLRYEADLLKAGAGTMPDREPLRFKRALAAGRPAARWQALADSLRTPFLVEWARRQAGAAEVAADQRRQVRQGQLTATRSAASDLRRAAAEGRDWSGEWRRLSALAARFLGEAAAGGDGSDGTSELAELAAALDRPLPLRLRQATVRLPQSALAGPDIAVLEVSVAAGDGLKRSGAFPVGPSAPAGTGWVGNVTLDLVLPFGPRDELICRVVAADGRLLLQSTVPSLADGGGPGSFGKLRPGDGGALHLQIDPAWWTALVLPAPAVVF
ncbi:MAG: hypothetical protein IPK64_12975 [bacterium]|nr:hypothetical protein [bacterium]